VSALCRYASTPEAASELDAALTELRAADAKQRLGYVLRSAAEVELQRGDASTARRRANEALRHARCLERPSDEVLARVALARAAALLGDELGYKRQRAEVTPEALRHVSAEARAAVAGLRAGDGGVRATPAIGRRRRRTKGA